MQMDLDKGKFKETQYVVKIKTNTYNNKVNYKDKKYSSITESATSLSSNDDFNGFNDVDDISLLDSEIESAKKNDD